MGGRVIGGRGGGRESLWGLGHVSTDSSRPPQYPSPCPPYSWMPWCMLAVLPQPRPRSHPSKVDALLTPGLLLMPTLGRLCSANCLITRDGTAKASAHTWRPWFRAGQAALCGTAQLRLRPLCMLPLLVHSAEQRRCRSARRPSSTGLLTQCPHAHLRPPHPTLPWLAQVADVGMSRALGAGRSHLSTSIPLGTLAWR